MNLKHQKRTERIINKNFKLQLNIMRDMRQIIKIKMMIIIVWEKTDLI